MILGVSFGEIYVFRDWVEEKKCKKEYDWVDREVTGKNLESMKLWGKEVFVKE